MIIEAAILTLVLLIGVSFVHYLGFKGWAIFPLGLLSGVSLVVLFGFAQLATGLPTSPKISIVLMSLTAASYWAAYLVRIGKIGKKHVAKKVFVAGATVVLVYLFMITAYSVSSQFMTLRHVDSMEYLAIGSLLQSDNFTESISLYQLEKRLVAVPFMHAAGNMTGSMYLVSLVPLLALSLIGVMVWIWTSVSRLKGAITKKDVLYIALGVGLLITGSRFVAHATYINSHLFVGALTVLLIGLCFMILATKGQNKEHRKYYGLTYVVLPTLILARPESGFFIILAILPFIANSAVSLARKSTLLSISGLTIIAWNSFLAYLYFMRGDDLIEDLPRSIQGMILFGVCILITSVFVRAGFMEKYYKYIPAVAISLLTVALIGLLAIKPDILVNSAVATYQNSIDVDGSWGSTLLLTYIILAIVLITKKMKHESLFIVSIAGFILLAFLLAYLRGGAYRFSDHDSLNRMLMQILPLIVTYIITAVLYGKNRFIKH